MGFFSWLFGNKESDPPESLVLGAKLRCPYGSHDGYLFVNSNDIDVNDLPKACVDDSEPLINILPFGNCYGGGLCEGQMEFGEKWENPEPQGEKINGKEIITTKSLLVCKKSGMQLKVLSSGQDGIFARHIILIRELDAKYPGLRAILEDPYGSLYLEDGMYEMAISFLEDMIKANGGEIQLYTLYDNNNAEGLSLKAALSRLLPACDLASLDRLINGMETTAVKNDMYDLPNLDVLILNQAMMMLIKKDCKETSELVKNHSFYRWQEENKLFLSVMADGVTNLAYAALMYQSCVNSGNNIKNSQRGVGQGGKGGRSAPNNMNLDTKQVGKKWGKHKTDYPSMKNYKDYQNYIDDIFRSPEKIIYDAKNKEYLYLNGDDLLRVGENGDFISLYPGAGSARVTDAIANGGTIWP